MSKFVADADALIKLHKAGVLEALLGWHEVPVPAAVYEEAVVAGKRELYEDALEAGGAAIRGSRSTAEASSASRRSLGPGERDVLGVYREENAQAILSDDRAFLGLLEELGVPYLTAASVVVGLSRSGVLGKEEAMDALHRLRGYVRESVYERARKELQELETGGER